MNLKPARIEAPWLSSAETQSIFTALEAGGHQARAVGGIVRNTLLGLPATDIDIATTALPQAVIELAGKAGLKTIPTGLAHGTVTVVAHSIPYEVTTLRRDVETDGRHATVAFTDDWSADARRRDFTINALYCDRDGMLFDPLDGAGDLSPPRIRFIGIARQRIAEDYLRILRFFRLTAALTSDGTPDPDGLAACGQLRHNLAAISGERIQSELMKLVAARHCVTACSAMLDAGVLSAVFPAQSAATDLATDARAFARLDAIDRHLAEPSQPAIRLAALTGVTTASLATLERRLKLSAADRRLIAAAVGATIDTLEKIDEMAARTLAYRLGENLYGDIFKLAWARASIPVDDAHLTHLARLPSRWRIPQFPLRGEDALASGYTPGPAIGSALAQLEAEWISAGFKPAKPALLERLRNRRP